MRNFSLFDPYIISWTAIPPEFRYETNGMYWSGHGPIRTTPVLGNPVQLNKNDKKNKKLRLIVMSPLLAFNVTAAAAAAASHVHYRCFSTSSFFSFFVLLHLFLFFLLPSSYAPPPSLPLLPPFLTHQNTGTHRCTMYRYTGTDWYIPIWQVSKTGLPETTILASYVHILKKGNQTGNMIHAYSGKQCGIGE